MGAHISDTLWNCNAGIIQFSSGIHGASLCKLSDFLPSSLAAIEGFSLFRWCVVLALVENAFRRIFWTVDLDYRGARCAIAPFRKVRVPQETESTRCFLFLSSFVSFHKTDGDELFAATNLPRALTMAFLGLIYSRRRNYYIWTPLYFSVMNGLKIFMQNCTECKWCEKMYKISKV